MSFSIEILENPKKILKYLQLGISLPVREEFYEFVLYDLYVYKAKSIVLRDNNKIVAHTLAYDDGGDILFFGFFGAINHEEKYITFLVEELVKYAQKLQYKTIRGPINPPIFIYGWGFMTEDSSNEICISKPVNPPIYQDVFTHHGFFIKSIQGTWEADVYKIPEELLKK